jgi:uncharacterized RDD family membrane protein YckC
MGMPLPEGMGTPGFQPGFPQPGFQQPYGGPPMMGQMPGGPQAIPLADSGLRFAARFLDRIIIFFLACIPSAALGGGAAVLAGRGGSGTNAVSFGATAATAVLSAAILLVYDGVVTAKLGGTLMKKAFGMRVVNAADGSPVNMQQALTRAAPSAVLALLSVIPVVGGIVGGLLGLAIGLASLIMLFTDKMRQTVSDKIAKTVVIKSK